MVAVLMFYVDRLQSLLRSHSPNNPCGLRFATGGAAAFGCQRQPCLCVWIRVRPHANVKAVTITPLITGILTLLRHTPPKILAPLRVPGCPPCSTSLSVPTLSSCFASSPVLGRTGTYGLWTDHVVTLIRKMCLGRKALCPCDKSSPKNVCWASGQKLLQCLLQDL